MDFGKHKFGGPFTEVEVEDVKTFLRLIPLIVCFILSVSIARNVQIDFLKPGNWINDVVSFGMRSWMFSLILIPFYCLLLYYVFHKHAYSKYAEMHSRWSSDDFIRVYPVRSCWTLQCFYI